MSEEPIDTTDSKDDAQRRIAEARIRLGAYAHYKGGRYILYGASIQEDTLEVLVHYYSCGKKTRWTRTAKNFFETMQWSVNEHKPRFMFLGGVSWQQFAEAAGLDELVRGLEALVSSFNNSFAG